MALWLKKLNLFGWWWKIKKMSVNFRNGTEENAHFSICLFSDLLVRRRIVKNVYFSIFLFGDLSVRRGNKNVYFSISITVHWEKIES